MAEKTIEQIQQELLLTGQLEETDRKRLALYIQQNEEHKKSLDFLEEQIKNLEQQQKIVDAISDEKGRVVEKEEIDLELQKARGELLKKTLIEQAKGRDLSKEELKLLIQIEEVLSDIAERAKDIARAKGQGKVLANLLGIDEANKNSLTYQMFVNPKQVLDGFNTEIEKAGGVASAISVSLLMKVQEATIAAFIATDRAYSSFAAATGASAAYNEVIDATARGNTALGISFEQAGKAVTDLYTNLNTFSKLNQSTQAQLVTTSAKLERLGISGTETAKSIQSLSMMMNVTETQAAKTIEKFAAMGQAIGVSSKQMISDFMAVKDQLAVFGSTMDKTFTDLAAQAKATGVAVSDLLTLANKFDTFEGAATQVAKLNAILGGPYLSAMSMIESTDPTERIEMLRQAVNNAGMSFESMSYYEKKAIMEAGGFKSVEEAQRVLSMSAGAYAKELENQEGNQKALNEAIERSIPIQEKLQLLMANFAILLGPIVELVSSLTTALINLIDNPIGRFIITMGTIITVVYKVAQAIMALRGATIALNAAFVTSPVGLVILGISAAVGLLYYLFMQKRSSPTLYEFFIMLPAIFASMAASGLVFASSILAIASTLPLLSLGLLSMAIALAAFANPITLFGIFTLNKALSTLVEQINKIETEKIINFRIMMEKIVEVTEPTNLKGFEQFSDKFDLVAQATAKVDASKTQTFTNLLVATNNLSQAMKINQTVVVKIGERKFDGYITEVVNNIMGDQAISKPSGV